MFKLLHQSRCHGRLLLEDICRDHSSLDTYNGQGLVGHVVEGPEVGCPVGVAETPFEWEQSGEDLRELILRKKKK